MRFILASWTFLGTLISTPFLDIVELRSHTLLGNNMCFFLIKKKILAVGGLRVIDLLIDHMILNIVILSICIKGTSFSICRTSLNSEILCLTVDALNENLMTWIIEWKNWYFSTGWEMWDWVGLIDESENLDSAFYLFNKLEWTYPGPSECIADDIIISMKFEIVGCDSCDSGTVADSSWQYLRMSVNVKDCEIFYSLSYSVLKSVISLFESFMHSATSQ